MWLLLNVKSWRWCPLTGSGPFLSPKTGESPYFSKPSPTTGFSRSMVRRLCRRVWWLWNALGTDLSTFTSVNLDYLNVDGAGSFLALDVIHLEDEVSVHRPCSNVVSRSMSLSCLKKCISCCLLEPYAYRPPLSENQATKKKSFPLWPLLWVVHKLHKPLFGHLRPWC